jgi:hypothetical protein
MGFIPPEPLSPEEGLKLMNFMNNIITVRLNVHERLPRHLKKWRVANGRVTFTFEQEFEMDLFTYSEDEKAPWLFADLRFLCSPAPEIDAGGHFLRALEAQANNILAQAGISGCFDFIHSFVLTHKINTLKTQAYQLSRQGWWGTLKVEPVHRSLVVQYHEQTEEWQDLVAWAAHGVANCTVVSGGNRGQRRGPRIRLQQPLHGDNVKESHRSAYLFHLGEHEGCNFSAPEYTVFAV